MTQLAAITYTLLVVIISNSWLEPVNAQTTKNPINLNVVEALQILSKAVASLEAKINGQSALLNNHVNKEEWQQPVPLYTTKQTIVAAKGHDVKLWCVVHGTPLPEIKWTKASGTLPSNRVDYGIHGEVLRIKNVELKDEGTYVCVAANGVGVPVSQSVSLKVNPMGPMTSMTSSKKTQPTRTSTTPSTTAPWVNNLVAGGKYFGG